jgi:tRNA(Arg) A34 adenosine deaminase TadA
MDPFLERAVQLAVDNVRSGKGGPFGAVIVRDGRIVSEGVNIVSSERDPTAHAEIVAIREACRESGHFELKGCAIYASCEPCPMCLGAIYWSRLDRLWYAATRDDAARAGFDDSFLYSQIPLDAASRAIPTQQLACAGALLPFEEWLRSPNKVMY